MDRLEYSFDLAGALALFIFIQDSRGEPGKEIEDLEESLRGFLYENLSIGEMENPKEMLRRLTIARNPRGGSP